MADEQEYTATFPVAGVDASCEYSRQPVDTTPVGQNVRAYDTLAERERGGSRSGLSKFIDELVNGASVIQHLAVVVDPQAEALANAGDDIEDPSDNGRNLLDDGITVRRVRSGGSASRHRTAPVAVALVQQAAGNNNGTGFSFAFSFGVAPQVGNLIVVVLTSYEEDAGAGHTVTGGAAYTQAGTTRSTAFDVDNITLSLWWKRATGADQPITCTRVSGGAENNVYGWAYEYSGISASPFDETAGLTGTYATSMAGPAVGVESSGNLAVTAFYTNNSITPSAPSGGFAIATDDGVFTFVHRLSSPMGSVTAGITTDPPGGPDNDYLSIAATFKKA